MQGEKNSYDNWSAGEGAYRLTKTDKFRRHSIGPPQVEDEYVVASVVNQSVEACHEFGQSHLRESALEYR